MALVANFHTALDTRYAIADGVIYSAFIYPLGSLTEEDLRSAIKQVTKARNTFGTEYSSGGIYFPGREYEDKEEPEKLDSNAI